MSRIGLRLGAAHVHHQSALDHKPRQPWAVRNMKAEMLANERKPWQPLKPRQIGNIEEEDRPTACVGICYYNKLMALEAKEDLANHNLVYKDQPSNNIPEPCDNINNICNDMEEDITVVDEVGPELSPDSNVIVIDDEAGAEKRHFGHGSSVTGDTIYIDDNEPERLQNDDNTVDFSHAQFA